MPVLLALPVTPAVPAMVVTWPARVISRTVLLPKSVTYIFVEYVEGDASRLIKRRAAAVAVVAARHSWHAGQGAGNASGRDDADGIVARVGHIHVAGAVHGHALRVIKQRRGAEAVVGALARVAGFGVDIQLRVK